MSIEEKIIIHLKEIDCPPIKKSVIRLIPSAPCSKIIVYIRKFLNFNEPMFLYFKEFAIYPDTLIEEIIEHVPGSKEIDINYSFTPACG